MPHQPITLDADTAAYMDSLYTLAEQANLDAERGDLPYRVADERIADCREALWDLLHPFVAAARWGIYIPLGAVTDPDTEKE